MKHFPLRELINKATTLLTNASVDSPRLSAEVLMAHSLGIDGNSLKLRLITDPQSPVPHGQKTRFEELCRQRATGIPVAYLTGVKEFFGLDFAVTPDTLIPRPDTELLVELALETARAIEADANQAQGQGRMLEQAQEQTPMQGNGACRLTPSATAAEKNISVSPLAPSFQFADLGTGTGCIAICLALHLTAWQGTALDISPQALAVAQANARRHQVTLTFLQGSFQSLSLPERSLHLMVSNPPYVSSAHYETLDHEVKAFEPQSALTPGTFHQSIAVPSCQNATNEESKNHEPMRHQPSNGLEDFFTIIQQAERLLAPRGFLLCEMGFDQGQDLVDYLTKRQWQEVAIHKDLAGHDRVIQARWPAKEPFSAATSSANPVE